MSAIHQAENTKLETKAIAVQTFTRYTVKVFSWPNKHKGDKRTF